MALVDATLSSTAQTVLGVLWFVTWLAGMIVLFVRYVAASRAFYRQFDWIKENWVTGVETPSWNIRRQMFGLAFRAQPDDPELERYRCTLLRRLLLMTVWLYGWGAVFVAGNIILLVTGLTR